jgi:hypothetical protein
MLNQLLSLDVLNNKGGEYNQYSKYSINTYNKKFYNNKYRRYSDSNLVYYNPSKTISDLLEDDGFAKRVSRYTQVSSIKDLVDGRNIIFWEKTGQIKFKKIIKINQDYSLHVKSIFNKNYEKIDLKNLKCVFIRNKKKVVSKKQELINKFISDNNLKPVDKNKIRERSIIYVNKLLG